MKKWEYAYSELKGSFDWNEMGLKGWELVAVTICTYGKMTGFFKRELL